MYNYPVKKVFNVIYKIDNTDDDVVVVPFKTRTEANLFFNEVKKKLVKEYGKNNLQEEGKCYIGDRICYTTCTPYLYVRLNGKEFISAENAKITYLK